MLPQVAMVRTRPVGTKPSPRDAISDGTYAVYPE
jgi:hypothetical protein